MSSEVFAILVSSFDYVAKIDENYIQLMREMHSYHFITFIGIASYSIEGITLLFTLRRDFIKHRSEHAFKVSYFTCYTFTIVLYILFGIFNYLKFSGNTKEVIFFNYDVHSAFIFTLQILYAVVS